MNKLSKEKRDQLVLVAIGTVVAIIALWYLLIGSQNKSLVDMATKTAGWQTKISKAEEALKKGTAIDEQLISATSQLRSIEDSMASGDMYSWVITTMKRFSSSYKVSLPLFSREVVGDVAVIPKFPYKAATFQLKGTAFYHDFGKFLADFENNFPYVRVQNIDFAPATSGDEREKLDLKFEIVTLIKPTGS